MSIQFKRGAGAPPTLDAGQPAFDTTAKELYVGDGTDNHPIGQYPRRATMLHDASIVTVGNALARDDSQGQRCFQDTPSSSDAFTNGFLIAAGTYTLRVIGGTGPIYGKVNFSIDGVVVVTAQDRYSASEVGRVTTDTTSIVIATSGWHTFGGAVNGKNASSSNYYLVFETFSLIPASD